ncbi:hypothetical protein BCR44DRAFT_351987 [Catenaria anguillulae PL171]|uniref:Uncharacterized protein n=1 Tax=Catenaria anguillulae PL171 TaxID=765915 RepID=A0A1Y2HQN6_9FUNG|nr:hypothetical protein BCR44DRAFT_351987 [Catenaria anguillulae PL171]
MNGFVDQHKGSAMKMRLATLKVLKVVLIFRHSFGCFLFLFRHRSFQSLAAVLGACLTSGGFALILSNLVPDPVLGRCSARSWPLKSLAHHRPAVASIFDSTDSS